MKHIATILPACIGIVILITALIGCNSTRQPKETDPNLETVTGDGSVNRTALTYDFLKAGERDTIVDFSHYSVPENAHFPSNEFEGRLTLLNVGASGKFEEIKDIFDYTDSTDTERMHLPPFDYEFVQSGSHLIPLKRGYLINDHPTWEYILEPGRVWDEKGDNGFSRVAIPFTLKQKNQNCLHNGVLTLLFKNDGTTSAAAYQIASESCGYFKFNMWGTVKTAYTPYTITSREELVQNYVDEVTGRMPSRPVSSLSNYYPGAHPEEFHAPDEVTPEDMTLYGFVIDSINYVGGCDTRHGIYPYCEVVNLPSYSTAKSVSAGMGLMRMEKLYPGSRDKLIKDLIDACDDREAWENVTIENALDMATGNYEFLTPMKDEGGRHTNRFFLAEDHQGKIDYSCSYYDRKETPGTQWVYHTSDTYIAGTAMNSYLRSITHNPDADYFTDLIVNDIFKPLKISPTLQKQQRTYDSVAQPFSGFGLFYHYDDVAKIGQFLNNGAMIDGQEMFDRDMFSAIINNNKQSGLKVNSRGSRYDNGFWLRDPEGTDCDGQLIPVLEGYGGIKIFLLPNKTVYYYFSDNYEYAGSQGIQESNRIRSFCESNK